MLPFRPILPHVYRTCSASGCMLLDALSDQTASSDPSVPSSELPGASHTLLRSLY